MKFPRTILLDTSDKHIFHRAAEPGEWAVSGGFAFLERDPAGFDGKEKLAFHSGWLGLESFGRATLVEVAEIDEAGFAAVIERLAAHFVSCYGAPDLVQALPAAREEAEQAAALCDHKLHSLLALERGLGESGLIERFRIIRPQRAKDHASIWEIVPEDESEGEGGPGAD